MIHYPSWFNTKKIGLYFISKSLQGSALWTKIVGSFFGDHSLVSIKISMPKTPPTKFRPVEIYKFFIATWKLYDLICLWTEKLHYRDSD